MEINKDTVAFDIDGKPPQSQFKEKLLLDRRIVFITSEITELSAQEVIENLKILDSLSNKPVELILNSAGGDVFSSLGIIDIIGTLRSDVHTYIVGQSASCAGMISVCGKRRFITKNSFFMAHELQISNSDYLSKIKDGHNLNLLLWENILKLYKEKTKLDEQDYDRIQRGELWLNPQQCLEKGIVDEILWGRE